MKTLSRLLADESGATAIEYALITALVSIATILVMTDVGVKLQETFASVRDGLEAGLRASRDG